MNMPTSLKQTGFALFEVLISILLLSFGLLGLVGLQARAVSISSDAQERNRAALLASEMASALWVAGSVTPDAATLAQWQSKVQSALPNGAGAVAVETLPTTGASANITITWKAPSRSSSDPDSGYQTRVIMP